MGVTLPSQGRVRLRPFVQRLIALGLLSWFFLFGATARSAPLPDSAPTAGPVIPAEIPQLLTPKQVRQMIDEALAERDRQEKIPKQGDPKPTDDDWVAVGSQLGITAKWDNGVWFSTPPKDFRFHIGGALQYDGAFYSVNDRVMFGPNGTGPFEDGVNLRRGRLRAEGTMWEVMDFVFELEFFNGVQASQEIGNTLNFRPQVFNSPGPTDANITLKQLPFIGNIRIGSQKEPFGLEHLNSYRYLEFMERSYLFDAFSPTAFNNGFSPGIMAFNTMFDERGTWWLGVFKNDTSLFGFGVGDGDYAVTGRLTGLPIWQDDGVRMWHVGVAASYRDPVAGFDQSRVRSNIRNAPFPLLPLLANTGNVFCSSQQLLNLETAAVCGPFTFQAEYTASWLNDASTPAVGPVGTFFTQGYYLEMLYFLTGEHRGWDRKTATFTRVIPHEPFFCVEEENNWYLGRGAWEVGARYSFVDLSGKGINGGMLHALTLGLNWYLHPNCKLQWNYDVAHRSQVGGASNGVVQALGMRMAVDF